MPPTSSEKAWHAHVRFFRIAKNGRLWIAAQCGKCWISATEQFRKEIPTNLVTFVAHQVRDIDFRMNRRSRGEMWHNRHTQTDRQTHPTTVTLAAHTRRRLMKSTVSEHVSKEINCPFFPPHIVEISTTSLEYYAYRHLPCKLISHTT